MPDDTPNLPVVDSGLSHFQLLQRQARAYSESTLVSETVRKYENCVVALMMADEMGESRLAVLQNIYFVHDRPAWITSFMVSRANRSNVFKGPLRWNTKQRDEKNIVVECYADLTHGGSDPRVSLEIDYKTAVESGWTTYKNKRDQIVTHPRWATPMMIEQMLRWRTASWLIRLYAPEVMMGLPTREEIDDEPREMIDVTPPPRPQREAVETVEEEAKTETKPEPKFWGIDPEHKEKGFETIEQAADWLLEQIAEAKDDRALDQVRDDNQHLIDKHFVGRRKGRINQALAARRTELAPKPNQEPAQDGAETTESGSEVVGDGKPASPEPQPSDHRTTPRNPEPSPSDDSKPDRPQAAAATGQGQSPPANPATAKPGGDFQPRKIEVPWRSGQPDLRTWMLLFHNAAKQCDFDAMKDLAHLNEMEITAYRGTYAEGNEYRTQFEAMLEAHWNRVKPQQ